jgi:hypothetical protein
MLEFFQEGGFGMYPVLVFGLILIGTAGRYAWDGEPIRLRFAIAMSALLIVSMMNAMLTDVATVFWHLQEPSRVPDAEFVRVLVTGLKESTRPGVLGGALLGFALMLIAVGVYRGTRKELRAAAA